MADELTQLKVEVCFVAVEETKGLVRGSLIIDIVIVAKDGKDEVETEGLHEALEFWPALSGVYLWEEGAL